MNCPTCGARMRHLYDRNEITAVYRCPVTRRAYWVTTLNHRHTFLVEMDNGDLRRIGISPRSRKKTSEKNPQGKRNTATNEATRRERARAARQQSKHNTR